ncbi:MAG TPA: hypothetical protein V6C64_02880 [Microcoleaceae cyanobacterium]|jgi:hypothetical protein
MSPHELNEPMTRSANPELQSPDLWLSLATVPILLGVLGGRAIAQAMQEVGQLSEEIFRGDRLPLLTFPPVAIEQPDTSDSDANNDAARDGNSISP